MLHTTLEAVYSAFVLSLQNKWTYLSLIVPNGALLSAMKLPLERNLSHLSSASPHRNYLESGDTCFLLVLVWILQAWQSGSRGTISGLLPHVATVGEAPGLLAVYIFYIASLLHEIPQKSEGHGKWQRLTRRWRSSPMLSTFSPSWERRDQVSRGGWNGSVRLDVG